MVLGLPTIKCGSKLIGSKILETFLNSILSLLLARRTVGGRRDTSTRWTAVPRRAAAVKPPRIRTSVCRSAALLPPRGGSPAARFADDEDFLGGLTPSARQIRRFLALGRCGYKARDLHSAPRTNSNMPPAPHDDRTDLQLAEAINSGDMDAFDVLYYRHRDWVMRLALRFTEHHDDALDVLQETFAYLVRKFPGFRLKIGRASCRERV